MESTNRHITLPRSTIRNPTAATCPWRPRNPSHTDAQVQKAELERLNGIIDRADLNSSHIDSRYLCTTDQYIETLRRAKDAGEPMDTTVCAAAANRGHLGALQWARHHNIPWDERTCMYAAKHGFLDILQWARENGCPWNRWTCVYAARNRHTDVLKWAIDNGCPWDEDL